jgi:hypothetical protein
MWEAVAQNPLLTFSSALVLDLTCEMSASGSHCQDLMASGIASSTQWASLPRCWLWWNVNSVEKITSRAPVIVVLLLLILIDRTNLVPWLLEAKDFFCLTFSHEYNSDRAFTSSWILFCFVLEDIFKKEHKQRWLNIANAAPAVSKTPLFQHQWCLRQCWSSQKIKNQWCLRQCWFGFGTVGDNERALRYIRASEMSQTLLMPL